MSFQWIIDNAVDATFDYRDQVALTTSRDLTPRTTTKNLSLWRFTITPPPGMKIQDNNNRSKLQAIYNAGMTTKQQIGFSQTAHNFLFGWQGTGSLSGTTATISSQVDRTFDMSGGVFTTDYRFRAGDIIQFGPNSPVCLITEDVLYSKSTNIGINRQPKVNSGTYPLVVGSNCKWWVMCTKLPTYKVTGLGFIEFESVFQFTEVLYVA